MEFEEWEPFYRRILEDFGFDRSGDEACARRLDEILGGTRTDDATLRAKIEGRRVTVVGNAATSGAEFDRLRGTVIAADEATSVLLAAGHRPDVIVTDLDGEVADQIAANREGVVAVVHGHGDNRDRLETWAPRFEGPTVATTQSRPEGRLRNFGGFTDGDRAVLLADHFGAEAIHLAGFDFERPNPKDVDVATKQRKLTWAYILIANLGREEINLGP